MIDKAIYVGMAGAQALKRQLEIVTNNLANTNTTGFHADFQSVGNIEGNQKGLKSRAYAQTNNTYTDFKSGPIYQTGRDLDIAINGPGFIAVQSKTGGEAYTRAGNLDMNKDGLLVTATGDLVLGEDGVINLREADKISISADGVISAQLKGQSAAQLVKIGKIKLINPPIDQVQKGSDGLFHLAEGSVVRPDGGVKINHGALEGSNVNPVEALTQLINLSRNFEFGSNMMKKIEDNASKANQILELPQ